MIYANWQPATTYAYIWQAGFEQLSLQLGKQLEQASNRVCALQGTMHASLDAATERLLSASRAEAELEVHSKYMGIEACGSNPLAPPWHLAPCSSHPASHAPRDPPRTDPPRTPPWLRAWQARRVPELEESVRQLEASLSATEDALHAVRAASQVA